jgi:hypothetical protein
MLREKLKGQQPRGESTDDLMTGSSINDLGQIAGQAIVKSSCPVQNPPAWQVKQLACTEIHAFLATPAK